MFSTFATQTGKRPRFDAESMKSAFGYGAMNRSTFLIYVLMAIARIEKAMNSLPSAATTVAAQAALSSALHGVKGPLTVVPDNKLGRAISADGGLVVVATVASPDRYSADKAADLSGSAVFKHTYVVSDVLIKVTDVTSSVSVTVLDGPLWCVLLRHLDTQNVSADELREAFNAVAHDCDNFVIKDNFLFKTYPTIVAGAAHEAPKRKYDEVVKERNAAVKERDAAVEERDALIEKHDAAVKERDAAVKERDALIQAMKDTTATLTASQRLEKAAKNAAKRYKAAYDMIRQSRFHTDANH
ncbi:hypothetical protein SPRG_02195 [Saprolegnia parasitica CBS 223.65]|uniref:Uncharacterized protein n=1 Tax=Saprolegnia parasitica (strain CBS 223.65) TaxID=695850 RepID=A0A067CSA0_SAPPC|nr:hypothetical protein SPRG_02195 [Saprolegnia parasitica CBS 223.65]KDO33388.1 hypothetical protein SPRG_02195 [Saprolegnia parasitica CBS 223.65]|eukprot:XP_012196136.1 hypothetical protein SPRG_02195 [Saprolegnia parasitica CBS 223.65]